MNGDLRIRDPCFVDAIVGYRAVSVRGIKITVGKAPHQPLRIALT
jgi:hypothetical protein